ncbi:MAG: histidine kinase [Eubacteriales bacterium]|nr:histidine kinase [Eubacteriales bacterium]
MKREHSYSLVKRLILIVLALLGSLLLLQAGCMLWGKTIVTREIYTSAQNNVVYLCDAFEQNLKQIRLGISERFFLCEHPPLIHFYVRMQQHSLDDEAQYQWTVKEILSEMKMTRTAYSLMDELVVYFPRLQIKLRSTADSNASTALGIEAGEVEAILSDVAQQTQLLAKDDSGFYLAYTYPETIQRNDSVRILMAARLNQQNIQRLLSDFNTYSGQNALVYHHATGSHVKSINCMELTDEDWRKLFPAAPTEASRQANVSLSSGSYVAMYSYSTLLQCSFVQLIPDPMINSVPNLLLNSMLVLCAITIVILILILHTLQRYVTSPIREVVSALHLAGKGNFDIRVTPQRSREYDALAKGFNHMALQLNEWINTSYRQTIMLQQAEMKTLQAQINPHFLYNSFFFLRSMLEEEQTEVAAEFSGYLGRYFSYLTSGKKDLLPLEQEYDHAIVYLKIQLMRFGETIEAEIPELPENLRRLRVPKLILQPVLENCIEHGRGGMGEKELIRISIRQEGERLRITVENSGKAVDEELLRRLREMLDKGNDDSRTTGLANVHRRLQLFYGPDSGVELAISSLGGLSVGLKIGGESHDASCSAGR